MSSTAMVVSVEGLEFRADALGEDPLTLDIELGAWVGLARPRTIRDTIKAAIREGVFRKDEHYRVMPARSARGKDDYWLTRAGALKIATRLTSPRADALVDDMIRVYIEAKALLAPPPPQPPAQALEIEHVHASRLRDVPMLRSDCEMIVRFAAQSQGVRVNAIHGMVRRQFAVPGIYHLSVLLWTQARRILEDLAYKRIAYLPRMKEPRPANVVDIRQMNLFRSKGATP